MVRIIHSARKHGILDRHIEHALRNQVAAFPAPDGITIVVGPGWDGTLLELGVRHPDDEPIVIHAMVARRKYLPRFREW